MLNGPIYVECIIFLFYGMWAKNKILFHVKQMRCNYIDSHDRGKKDLIISPLIQVSQRLIEANYEFSY